MGVLNDLDKVVLACLIHHLDDLVLRSWRNINDAPKDVCEVLDDVKKVCDFNNNKRVELVNRASKLAHGDDDKGQASEAHQSLMSIFSSVALEGDAPLEKGWFSPQVLGNSPVYPDIKAPGSIGSEDYLDLCNGLFGELGELLKAEAFSPNLVALLMQRYCSFVPHEMTEDGEPDVSLYDHLRLTAAFGSCLYGCMGTGGILPDKGQYLMAFGDLSGVQKFVYSISSRGALKTLRARSFFLELLTLHVVQRIVEECQVSPLNILYATGGLFSVILPSVDNVADKLDSIRQSINQYLANVHDGRVYFAMDYSEPFVDDDFFNPDLKSARKERDAKTKVQIAKRKRFSDEITGANRAEYIGPFEPECLNEPVPTRIYDEKPKCVRCSKENPIPASLEVKLKGRLKKISYTIYGCMECLSEDKYKDEDKNIKADECSVCHTESAFLLNLPEPKREGDEKEPVSACLFCNLLYHLGEHLPMKASSVIVRKKSPPSYDESKAYVIIEDDYYYLKIKPDKKDFQDNSFIWAINEFDPLELRKLCGKNPSDRIGSFMMSRHQPYDDNYMPLDFEDIAKRSVGSDKLGVLKMDVDSLGNIFTKGLRHSKLENVPLSRRLSLSRQMEMFFKVYIDEICRGNYRGKFDKPQADFTEFTLATNDVTDKFQGRNAVVVYSGGDDLFLVGAWSDVTELAFDIHRSFKSYTAENPEIDVSAGLVLTHKGYPLYHMADLANEALKKAKNHKEKIGDKEFAKASISMFYTPQVGYASNSCHQVPIALKWEKIANANWITAQDVLALLGKFASLKEFDKDAENRMWKLKLSRQFIQRLFQMADIYGKSGKLYLPYMHYILAEPRSAPGFHISRDDNNWNDLSCKLRCLSTVKYLPYALTWIDLLCRSRKS